MNREDRYIVVKKKDVDRSLTWEENQIFNILLEKIKFNRLMFKNEPLECVVVEKDWPEYETVWKIIEERVDGK